MKRSALLVALAVGVGVAVGADGAVRYVSSVSGSDAGAATNPAAPCATIQYAVNRSAAGDELRIAAYEVSLVGLPIPSIQTNACVYTGSGPEGVIRLTNGVSLSLKGGYLYQHTIVTNWLQGVVPAQVDGQNVRRCLYAMGANGVTNHVELLEFVRGSADNGANVYAAGGGGLQLVGTPIHGGTATGGGGGVYMSGVDFSVSLGSYSNLALPQMTGLLPIYSNSAARGGGLYVNGGYPVMSTVGVMNNVATANGGGVYIQGGVPFVLGGTIQNNVAGGNGGGIYLSNSVARVGGMIVTSNRAVYGGAIFLDGPFAFTLETATLLANNYIQNNEATGGRGGALYFNSANVGIVNNVITGNRATNGAAAYLYGSSPRFFQNTIADNAGDTGLFVTHGGSLGQWMVYNTPFGAFSNFLAGVPIPSWPAFTNTVISGHATAVQVESSGNSLLQNKVDMGFTLWWNNDVRTAGAGSVNRHDDIDGDPLYTSKGMAPNDVTPYHIATNSPAVDSGTTVGLTLPGTDLLLDIDAQLRPSGKGMDIGADEVVTDPFSVWFVPAAMAATVAPGTTVTNQHMLLNSGTQNDMYHVSATNTLWSGSVSPAVVSLNSQSYTTVTVVVTVPGNAPNGATNITLVKAVSQADTNRTAVAVDATGSSTNTGGGSVRYVWSSSPTPGSPYTSPSTAGHDIQTVVEVCAAGDTVLVYPGAYNSGGAAAPGASLTNRVCLTNAITLVSLSGATNTQILGATDPVATNGPAAVRCLYVNAQAVVSGFSLMDGHTLAAGGSGQDLDGGGACLAGGGTLSNCAIVGCSAGIAGGGLYTASTNAVCDTRIQGCVSRGHGGGAYLANGALYNGLVFGNAAATNGGGIYAASGAGVYNCTIVTNAAANGGGLFVNTTAGLINNILYFNAAPTNANLFKDTASVKNCCTTPDPGGTGIVTADPRLVGGGDYHLQSGSPCIDSGSTDHDPRHDLDGNPRPLDGNAVGGAAMDIGCYEVYNANGDSDGDSAKDGDEAIAGTDPLDASSYFRITAISNAPSWTVYFPSVAGRLYTLYGATNLVSGVWTNVPGAGPQVGAGGVDSIPDTNVPAKGPFYRMKVGLP